MKLTSNQGTLKSSVTWNNAQKVGVELVASKRRMKMSQLLRKRRMEENWRQILHIHIFMYTHKYIFMTTFQVVFIVIAFFLISVLEKLLMTTLLLLLHFSTILSTSMKRLIFPFLNIHIFLTLFVFCFWYFCCVVNLLYYNV